MAERQQLALLYQPGQSLWRVPITHFSPWDCNWPYGPPSDAQSPNQPEPNKTDPSCKEPDCQKRSIIEVQNQVLGEPLDLAGTRFSLHYSSDRVPGRKPAMKIPLSGAEVPGSLKRIEAAGGRIVTPRTDIGEAGAFAVFVDPAGAEFGLYEEPQK